MKIALINGSPRVKDSTSGALLDDLKKCISKGHNFVHFHFNKPDVDKEIVTQLSCCDVWVFAFPLYIDGVPSHLLSCLNCIEKMFENKKGIRVFCIVNSGFYEGIQNAIAIEIMKNFCEKITAQWGFGIGVGGGGGLNHMKAIPLGYGPKKSVGKALQILANSMETNAQYEDIFISISFPRLLYKIAAERIWKQQAKKNGKKI